MYIFEFDHALLSCFMPFSEQIQLLLTRMDSGITSWYVSLLQPEDTRKPGDWGTTLATFMDLLEALTAARFRLGTCVSSQRLLFIQTPALLRLLDSQLDYFVKKHVLLLLKRTLLQTSGEDWLAEAVSPVTPQDAYLAEDMGAFTESILQAVNSGWLMHVPGRASPSFFGGTSESWSGDRADDVMLRAVSLVLLKSLEYQTQSAHSKSKPFLIKSLVSHGSYYAFMQYVVWLCQQQVAVFSFSRLFIFLRWRSDHSHTDTFKQVTSVPEPALCSA